MMEPEITKLGNNIPVPSVLELVKQPLTKVPPRYVRIDQDPPTISNTTSLPEVPVVDLSKLRAQDFKGPELQNLHHACQEWGFFQLINHGVDTELVEKVKKGIQEFFNLPVEEKKKLWQKSGDFEGFGQLFVVTEEQKLDWADLFNLISLPPSLRKPHLFPNLPLPFRDNFEEYGLELRSLALELIYLMAEALKMEPNDMKQLFEGGWQAMRMNYYPPCPEPELVIGLSPHSDADGLTILLQLNEIEGLQIRKGGIWVPVNPLPNAFIVNIGDVLEIVTNGIYRSIEHRATVNSEKERLSVATFLSPKLDAVMGPAQSLVSPESPALYRRIVVADFYKAFFSQELRGKAHLKVVKAETQNEK